GTPYIVLEYLDGESLEQRMERERDLPLNDAVRITRHVGRALSRAHAQGIVHRDLKPGNVFLTRSEDDELGWVAKVLDFGIAKLEEHGIASTTKTGTLLGTPLFMSPEQVRGASSVDSRTDLYALGMVFYNMITGNFAFNGESFTDVLVAICGAPLPDLRAASPWIPVSVGDWFQRACARDPQQRFQSADEMVEALDMALGVSTGVQPRPGSAPEVKIDTLRGHAPPIAHAVPRTTPSAAGAFGAGATHVLGMDPTLLKSNSGLSSSLQGELTVPTSSRAPLYIGGGALLLLLLGGALWLGRGHTATAESTQLAPSSSTQLSAAKPAQLVTAALSATAPALTATATAITPPAPAPAPAPEASAAAPAAAANNAAVAPRTETKPHPAQTPARPARPAQPTKPRENAEPRPAPSPRSPSTDMGF
ncbi:MAG: serine/threonine-protein kinase, partial [Polyangiaceae bacterium]